MAFRIGERNIFFSISITTLQLKYQICLFAVDHFSTYANGSIETFQNVEFLHREFQKRSSIWFDVLLRLRNSYLIVVFKRICIFIENFKKYIIFYLIRESDVFFVSIIISISTIFLFLSFIFVELGVFFQFFEGSLSLASELMQHGNLSYNESDVGPWLAHWAHFAFPSRIDEDVFNDEVNRFPDFVVFFHMDSSRIFSFDIIVIFTFMKESRKCRHFFLLFHFFLGLSKMWYFWLKFSFYFHFFTYSSKPNSLRKIEKYRAKTNFNQFLVVETSPRHEVRIIFIFFSNAIIF